MIRLAIFNIAATALFLAGLGEGYVQPVIAGDSSRVVVVIGAAGRHLLILGGATNRGVVSDLRY